MTKPTEAEIREMLEWAGRMEANPLDTYWWVVVDTLRWVLGEGEKPLKHQQPKSEAIPSRPEVADLNRAIADGRAKIPHHAESGVKQSPTPEWKPGQMLVNAKLGNIVRLKSPIPNTNNWDGDYWALLNPKWQPVKLGIDMSSPWEPYPRVGDWVRCLDEGCYYNERPFQWSIVQDGQHSNLEPASLCWRPREKLQAAPPLGEDNPLSQKADTQTISDTNKGGLSAPPWRGCKKLNTR